MISVLEAKSILEKNIKKLPSQALPVSDALGSVISKDVIAPMDVPSFNNSAMDGYAFCFDESKTSFIITNSVQAGDAKSHSVKSGDTVRIFTGAPIPDGANTVIQQELVSLQHNSILFEQGSVKQGDNVRLRGAQCKTGDVIIKAGTVITPGVVALLSSVGISNIDVYRKPNVKVIVTGNELVNTGTPLHHGEIYNTNQPAIIAYLNLLSITNAEAIHVKDNLDELRNQIADALNSSDVLILSGGISVGEYDLVYKALSHEGVQPLFYKIKQKPGKPMFAGKKDKTVVFAMPGNPAAVVTCFNQYVKPCLQYMCGYENTFSTSVMLPLAHHWEKKGTMANILKAVVKNGEVNILQGQDSYNLLAYADANAFALLHENDMVKKKGDLIEVFIW